jgi:hypothetical protein
MYYHENALIIAKMNSVALGSIAYCQKTSLTKGCMYYLTEALIKG